MLFFALHFPVTDSSLRHASYCRHGTVPDWSQGSPLNKVLLFQMPTTQAKDLGLEQEQPFPHLA
jgi:hypothetical protein